jgi:purine-binding chemotaxis protein CheW
MTLYVRLRVAREEYAMPVEHVLEVADLGQVRVVPGSRPALIGVWNLRSQILPVVDLALLLRIPRTVQPSRLLVARAGHRRAGFAIDDVSGVGLLADSMQETESELLIGAALDGDGVIGVIDVPRVFDSLEQAWQ